MPQKTIKQPVSCRGISLHKGKDSFLEFRPAPADSGIYFLNNGRKISARVNNVVDTKRGTALLDIYTVEHVLAAVYGLNIDNIEIFLDGEEPPAMDGSSIKFVEALKSAGTQEFAEQRKIFAAVSEIIIKDGDSYVAIYPSSRLSIEAAIDYSASFIGRQSAVFDEAANNFEKEIAPARTFGFIEEVEELKKRGLAKGASFENAVVISKTGYITAPRMENELARHKILDIMGDIALAGYKIIGKIVSYKAGHRLNVELVRRVSIQFCEK